MDKKVKITNPKYQQIAADVAAKIVNNQYKVGDKIFARSALASQYGVSAETARRAICVLSDMQIVKATKGSGVVITSRENAVYFVRHHKDIDTVTSLKNKVVKTIEGQQKENEYLIEQINLLVDKVSRFNRINPFIPYEIELNGDSNYLGQNLSEINLWHSTSATIVGIRREDTLIMSPGPYATVNEGDILYFVGADNAFENVKSLFYNKK
nr:TrkA C-terminal domain-containing protein [Alkalibaculum bacchi]